MQGKMRLEQLEFRNLGGILMSVELWVGELEFCVMFSLRCADILKHLCCIMHPGQLAIF